MCRPSNIDGRCEIRLLYLLKILILYIVVCELRRGFALQCFHYVLNAYLYCVNALVGGVISIRDPYICAVSRVCANESHAVFHGAVSVQLKRSYRLHASIKAYFVGTKL